MIDDSKSIDSAEAKQGGGVGDAPTALLIVPETFQPVLHTTFRVQCHTGQRDPHNKLILDHGGKSVEVELVEVTLYPGLKDKEGGFDHRPREPFALLFRGKQTDAIYSALHNVTHERLGSLLIFLNPVQVSGTKSNSSGPDSQYFEAVFN